MLERIASFIRRGEPYLTDEELAFGLKTLDNAMATLTILEDYGCTVRALRQDWTCLENIRLAREVSASRNAKK